MKELIYHSLSFLAPIFHNKNLNLLVGHQFVFKNAEEIKV
jgi:hypothetical protein